MATLILDIETHAPLWRDLPGITRSALVDWIDKSPLSEKERQQKRDSIQDRLAFSPFTASIISLCLYDVERKTGAVYFTGDGSEESFDIDDFKYKERTEKQLLEDFWEGARDYDTFVTFNGRSFTLPFLYHRSMIAGVRPTVEIARERYVTKQRLPYHVDLLDEFSFHGAMNHRPSLALLCGVYNIKNASLLAGEEIAEAYEAEQFARIAEKNSGDVQAITELYDLWKKSIAPASFLNAVEG